MNWREVLPVVVDDPPHFAATAFLAVLAYPEDASKRGRFVDAVLAYVARYQRGQGVSLDGPLTMRDRDVQRALNRAARMIDRRLRAVVLANKVVVGRYSEQIPFEAPRSIREAITADPDGGVFFVIGPRQPGPRPGADAVDLNVFRDVWTPSKPVLHLAGALYDHLNGRKEHGIIDLIFGPHWVIEALKALPINALTYIDAGLVRSGEVVMLRREKPPPAQT